MTTPSSRSPRDPSAPRGRATGAGTPSRTDRVGGTRVGRRERARPVARRSFFDRYRPLIIGAVVLALVGLVGAVTFQAASARTYDCTTIWDPSIPPIPPAGSAGPSASGSGAASASPSTGASGSPAASASDSASGSPGASGSSPSPTESARPSFEPTPTPEPRIGIVQPDMGRQHSVDAPQPYTYCPPASGNHHNRSGQGPIDPNHYGPDDFAEPAGWVHNLEHGAMVLLYRCQEGDPGCEDAAQEQIADIVANFPDSPVCQVPRDRIGPIAARFDDMAWPYAAIVWGRVLPLETLDRELIYRFFQQEGERTNPEPQCLPPSPSVSVPPVPSVAPSASGSAPAAPSGSGTPSGSASPSAN